MSCPFAGAFRVYTQNYHQHAEASYETRQVEINHIPFTTTALSPTIANPYAYLTGLEL